MDKGRSYRGGGGGFGRSRGYHRGQGGMGRSGRVRRPRTSDYQVEHNLGRGGMGRSGRVRRPSPADGQMEQNPDRSRGPRRRSKSDVQVDQNLATEVNSDVAVSGESSNRLERKRGSR